MSRTLAKHGGGATGGGGTVDTGALPYPPRGPGRDVLPRSVAITPHHFVLLHDDGELAFVSRVSLQTIQTLHTNDGDGVDPAAPPELLADPRRPDAPWVRRGRALHHVHSPDEGRDAWRLTLGRAAAGHTHPGGADPRPPDARA